MTSQGSCLLALHVVGQFGLSFLPSPKKKAKKLQHYIAESAREKPNRRLLGIVTRSAPDTAHRELSNKHASEVAQEMRFVSRDQ